MLRYQDLPKNHDLLAINDAIMNHRYNQVKTFEGIDAMNHLPELTGDPRPRRR